MKGEGRGMTRGARLPMVTRGQGAPALRAVGGSLWTSARSKGPIRPAPPISQVVPASVFPLRGGVVEEPGGRNSWVDACLVRPVGDRDRSSFGERTRLPA